MRIASLSESIIKPVTVVVVFAAALTSIALHGPQEVARDRNLLVEGHVDQTIEQGKRLLQQLRNQGWDPQRVDRALLRVPDQDFAQALQDRAASFPTFTVPTKTSPVRAVYEGQVAFFSLLYVRRNFRVVKGIEGIATYEGFMIAGWRDGRVEKVPVDQVRLLAVGDMSAFVFPGMRQYSADLPLYIRPYGSGAAPR